MLRSESCILVSFYTEPYVINLSYHIKTIEIQFKIATKRKVVEFWDHKIKSKIVTITYQLQNAKFFCRQLLHKRHHMQRWFA